jgi:LPS export ABC transporter protein LptC
VGVKRAGRAIAQIGLWGAVGFLPGCRALQPPGEREAPADITFHNLQVRQYRAGTLAARASLETLDYRRNEAQADAKRLVLRPVEDGEITSTITAATARLPLKQGVVQLGGGVTYDSLSGDKTETEACSVNLVTRIASGDRPVLVHGPGYRVEAAGFEANYRAALALQLKGGVRSVISDEPPPVAKPQSGRLK